MTNGIASGIANFPPNFISNFIANFLLSCKAHRMAPTTAYFMTICTSNCLPFGFAHLPQAPQNAVKP